MLRLLFWLHALLPWRLSRVLRYCVREPLQTGAHLTPENVHVVLCVLPPFQSPFRNLRHLLLLHREASAWKRRRTRPSCARKMCTSLHHLGLHIFDLRRTSCCSHSHHERCEQHTIIPTRHCLSSLGVDICEVYESFERHVNHHVNQFLVCAVGYKIFLNEYFWIFLIPLFSKPWGCYRMMTCSRELVDD